jgi:predicted metal-dependent hydrolase
MPELLPHHPPLPSSPFRPGVDYRVIRSRRRSLELRVYPDRRVEVRVPWHCPRAEVEAFVASREDWLRQRLAEAPPIIVTPPAPGFRTGEAHLYLGERYPLAIAPARRAATGMADGQLLLLSPAPDDPGKLADQLGRWYRRQAEQVFGELLDQHFPFFAARGHARPVLKIRTMKSRWGSLSSRGGMTLNLELIKTPLGSIEYVVIHELCHLEHMNHGPGFRSLLTRLLPDWQQRKRELNARPLI